MYTYDLTYSKRYDMQIMVEGTSIMLGMQVNCDRKVELRNFSFVFDAAVWLNKVLPCYLSLEVLTTRKLLMPKYEHAGPSLLTWAT